MGGEASRPLGQLFVVATPIGNLGDITLRALAVLRSVPLIAAEDTRITRRLLDRHAIETPLLSFHARSGPARLERLIEHLRGGEDLAVVTDAGTPGISDPGEELVRAWAGEGGRVIPIPGPSAVLAAVVASGIAGPRWGFEGFLPRSGRERRERIARVAADDRATVLYEAPSRLAKTLADLTAACGPDRETAICRELTKLHEQIVRGSLTDLARAVEAGEIQPRGEVAIVVGPAPSGEARRRGDEEAPGEGVAAARAEVEALVAAGTARGIAAREVAARTGLRRRDLYGDPGRD